MRADELFQQITDQLIADIEAGAGNWEMPWHTIASTGLARSIDGRPYWGLNQWILSLASAANGWSTTWGTYLAWKRNGHQVRRGERGTKVVLWKQVEGDVEAAEDRPRMFARTFTVFAADQTDAACPALSEVAVASSFPLAAAALVATGARVEPSTRPHYRPADDVIGMPPVEAFDSESHWLSTWCHETVHWTGGSERLARDLSSRFGEQAYGFEELVAEIGSAFWCAEWGITTPAKRLDHADYVADWLAVLKADSRAIVTAASQAQTAVDYIDSFTVSAEAEPIGA